MDHTEELRAELRNRIENDDSLAYEAEFLISQEPLYNAIIEHFKLTPSKELSEILAQWANIFIQGFANNSDLKAALLGYVYPFGMPNLTKDKTSEFEINSDTLSLYHRGFNETIQLLADINSSGNNFIFGARFVVIDKTQILKFD